MANRTRVHAPADRRRQRRGRPKPSSAACATAASRCARRAPRSRTSWPALLGRQRSTWCSPPSDAKRPRWPPSCRPGRRQRQGHARADRLVDTSTTATVLQAHRTRRARRRPARPQPEHVQVVVRTEWADLRSAPRAAPPRGAAARDRTPLRRADRFLARPHRLRARRHAHPRQPAYLEMFGFEDFEDIEGMSLLDLVAPEDADDFKQLLKRLSKGETPPPRYELEAQRTDGNRFAADDGIHRRPPTKASPACRSCSASRTVGSGDWRAKSKTLRQRDQVTGLLNRQHVPARARSRASPARRRAASAPGAAADGARQLREAAAARSAWTRPTTCSPALAERLRSALGPGRRRRALRRTPFAVLLRRQRPRCSTVALAERMRAAFDGHIFEVGDAVAQR